MESIEVSYSSLSDISEAICCLLGRWAIPSKELTDTFHNVQRKYGKGEREGQILFSFVTRDKFRVDLPIVVEELIAGQQDYLDGMMYDLVSAMNGARKNRQKENVIQLPNTSSVKEAVRNLLKKKAMH